MGWGWCDGNGNGNGEMLVGLVAHELFKVP